MAILLGLAACLKEKNILKDLCGKIKLCVVPAEEGVDISYRKQLRDKGVIKYLTGKQEFIGRDYFDDVDIAFMLHSTVLDNPSQKFTIKKGFNGVVMKEINFIGKAAHAGGSPDKGINALNAASLAMQAIGLLRETFKDDEHIRFHPIITKGGDAVNAVPAKVMMESYLRAASVGSLNDTNEKINFAIISAAAAIGATVEINDFHGYSPMLNDKNFTKLALETFREVAGDDGFADQSDIWNTGSTDMGDVSCLIPSIHPYVAGAKGTAHGKDYYIAEPEKLYYNGLAFELIMLKNLLGNGAQKAYGIIKNFNPIFKSVKEYCDYIDKRYVSVKSEIDTPEGKIILKKQMK